MKNWSTTQIVLTLIGVFAFGMVLGYFIPPFNTWFPATDGAVGERRGGTTVSPSEQIGACCGDTNPCGKSSSWFSKHCSGKI